MPRLRREAVENGVGSGQLSVAQTGRRFTASMGPMEVLRAGACCHRYIRKGDTMTRDTRTTPAASMAKDERLLRLPSDLRSPCECAACGRVFSEPDVLNKFDEHNCDDNSNQPAARTPEQWDAAKNQ